jgi:hypothetical protein
MTDLRTPGSRAVLIGASTYASNDLDNVYAVADTVSDLRQTLIDQCGMARESIRFLSDWEDAHAVGFTSLCLGLPKLLHRADQRV